MTCQAAPPKGQGKGKAAAIITKKLKSATPAQLKQYRMMAAKRMVTDLAKASIKKKYVFNSKSSMHA